MALYIVSQYRGVRRKLIKQQPIKQYSVEKAIEAFKVVHESDIRPSDVIQCSIAPSYLQRMFNR